MSRVISVFEIQEKTLLNEASQSGPGQGMEIKQTTAKKFADLLLSALTGAILICAALFVGWFIGFILMDFIGKTLLVGMNYLAWPIVFPLFSLPVIFLLMLMIIPMFQQPYPEILAHKSFLFGVLLPIFVVTMGLMFATCPLEQGGTLLSLGRDGFANQ
jgi:hypothetical protein